MFFSTDALTVVKSLRQEMLVLYFSGKDSHNSLSHYANRDRRKVHGREQLLPRLWCCDVASFLLESVAPNSEC